jgi:hypothetical protein
LVTPHVSKAKGTIAHVDALSAEKLDVKRTRRAVIVPYSLPKDSWSSKRDTSTYIVTTNRSEERPSIRLFVLHHQAEVLRLVPRDSCLEPVDLTKLDIGHYQTNLLGESRAFLRSFDSVSEDYIGFINGRFNQKYFKLTTRLDTISTIARRLLAPGWVLTPWPAYDWLRLTSIHHPTMIGLIDELLTMHGLPLAEGRASVWANEFICHRSVFLDWHRFWRTSFEHFVGKYGLDLPFENHGTDPERKTAFFLERITTAYFANRPDVRVVGLE